MQASLNAQVTRSLRPVAFALLIALSGPPATAQTIPTFTRSDYAAAGAPRTIATADFNRDGWADLATAGTGSNSVRVLLNNGPAGGFRALAERALGGGPFDLAAGDLNRDGIPDLAVANADANAVDVLIGAGDGSFASVSRIDIAGGNPRGITIADYDRDGASDILVTEFGTSTWRILYGNGAGGVSRQDRFGAIRNPQGILAADFNRDGRPDVAIAGAGINIVAIFYSRPNNGIEQVNVTVGAAVNVLTTGDYDRDGWLDLSAASASNRRIYTLRGGPAGLAWTATNATGASPRGIAAVDVNHDGRLDLVTGNRAASTVSVHPGTGSATFAAPLTFAAGAGSRAVAAADFDHDGAVDLAAANESGSSTTVLTNSTSFVAPAFRFSLLRVVPPSGASGPDELDVADFDRDGRLDVASETGEGLIVWLAARGRVVVDIADANDIAVADFNRDSAPDIVTADFFGKRARVYLNRGDGTFVAAPELISTLPVFRVATGDVNRDGRADVVYQANDESTRQGILRVALGRGDGTFTIAGSGDTFVPFAWQIVVADMDNDGRPDIVTGGPNPSGVNVWYGRGDGTPSRMVFYDFPPSAFDMTVADLNEDGRLDLIAVGEPNIVQVRLALAAGGFGPVAQQPATLKPSDTFIQDIGAGDLNLDGHVDVITNEADVLYGRGDGTFKYDRLSTFEFDSRGTTATVADYNGDALPDMLFVETGGFTALINERGGTNHPPTVSAGPDRTVTIHDFFDDTSIDATGADPDMHELQFQWQNADGAVVSNDSSFFPSQLPAGQYTFTVTATDGRGGQASDSMVLTVAPYEEIYFHASQFDTVRGAWRSQDDPAAAGGTALRHPDASAAKLAAPLADPVNYIEASFPADAAQAYKLWLRLKADANFWANDSVFVQFDGATDANGNPVYPIGTTSALAVNLEECSGCGISGWGWEDDRWGAKDATSATVLRFPSGHGRIRIQTREDGVAIDQVVLSSKKYLTTRPGTAKSDSVILPRTVPFD